MEQFLLYYQRPEPATWAFLSTFLVIGIYFMFHRILCVRNMDIALLVLFAPGLMMVYEGRKLRLAEKEANISKIANLLVSYQQNDPSDSDTAAANQPSLKEVTQDSEDVKTGQVRQRSSPGELNRPKTGWTADRLEYWGFVWLLSVCGALLLRMLLDTAMVRRPLLEPNLSSGGLTFIAVSLFLFLMANILTCTPDEQRIRGGRLGPGYVLLNTLPDISTSDFEERNARAALEGERRSWRVSTARLLAIAANLTIAVGMVLIGYFHYENLKMGIGAAGLFLLLPYTAQMTGRLDHMIPGACLIVALLCFRLPVLSGIAIGCTAGLVYYPFFLLPLWLSFYWQRGLRRFLIGFFSSLAALTVTLSFLGEGSLISNLQTMYGIFPPAIEGLQGIWGLGWHPYFRLPVMVAFVLLAISFVFWPAQKNLATLGSCSAAIMIAAQFWHGYGGGLYAAWFLPFVLLTIFRPNLDHSVALHAVRPFRSRESELERRATEDSVNLAQAG